MQQETVGEHQRRIWWSCPSGEGHVWQADATTDFFEGAVCPCCSGRKPEDECYALSESEASNHVDGAIPSFIRRGWWMCRRNEQHIWFVKPTAEATSRPCCPFCTSS